MALYKTHVKFNVFIFLPILLGAIYYFLHPIQDLMLIFSGSFVYSTLFMNPDLDLAHQIRLFSIRGLFTLPFRLYAKLFSHRGLSHHIALGSLTRIIWLMGWAALIFFACYKTLPSTGTVLSFYKRYEIFLLYGFAGICFADWGHLLLDIKKGST